MSTRLTHKQRGFVKDIAKGETGVQAAFNNYDTEDYSTAGSIAVENLQKPAIINALEEALPTELLTQVHREGLLASKPIYITTSEGEHEKIDEEPDYSVRHKYLDTAYKLKGSYAPEKRVTLNVELEASDEIRKAADILNEYYRNNTRSDGIVPSIVGTETQDKE